MRRLPLRASREWVDTRSKKWAPTYAEKVEQTPSNNRFPRIGRVPIATISVPVLLGALRSIEARGSLEVAARARRWAGEIFRDVIATGRAKDDPATALKTSRVVHYPALRRDKLGEFQRKFTDVSLHRILIHVLHLLYRAAAGARWCDRPDIT